MKRALLVFLAVAALPAALMLTLTAPALHTSGSNRGWTPDLKPGAILTLGELERLEERGWRLVRAALYAGVYHDAPCPSGLLLVYKPGLHRGPLGVSWRVAKWVSTTKIVRLSDVANATAVYRVEPRPGWIYTAPVAYCLEPLNNTAYRVTNYLKPVYYTTSIERMKVWLIRVHVDHERFERVLRREWLAATTDLMSPVDAEKLNETLRIRWARVEKHIASVTVELDVPIIRAPRRYGLTYPHTYMRLVIAPLLRLLGDPLWLSRGQLWLHYNLSNVYDPYPPNWLVYGGSCLQYAMWSVRLALVLNVTRVYYMEVRGSVPHASAVYCSGEPVYFSHIYGGYYGLLAVNSRSNKTIICWLWSDTSYAVTIWSRVPKLGAWIQGYALDKHYTLKPIIDERYRVVKTWVGRSPPDTNITG